MFIDEFVFFIVEFVLCVYGIPYGNERCFRKEMIAQSFLFGHYLNLFIGASGIFEAGYKFIILRADFVCIRTSIRHF